MTRFVIGPDVALRLAREGAEIAEAHLLLAPTLMRSQLLALLFQMYRAGEISKNAADETLVYVRGLRIRLLGDRVLQKVAWEFADQLGWPDTLDAEYLALTRLQADAYITLDEHLARVVQDHIELAPYEALMSS